MRILPTKLPQDTDESLQIRAETHHLCCCRAVGEYRFDLLQPELHVFVFCQFAAAVKESLGHWHEELVATGRFFLSPPRGKSPGFNPALSLKNGLRRTPNRRLPLGCERSRPQPGRLVVRRAGCVHREGRHQVRPLCPRRPCIGDSPGLVDVRLFTHVLPQTHACDRRVASRLVVLQGSCLSLQIDESFEELFIIRHLVNRWVLSILV
ncbi:hypothetical protein AQI88_40570 [Streptomyces cellostaticus]|uniref:Uncharacterized protein n=1 Tax=Streptomyces cellostaticus TaxID=67285 RepID=A0A124HAC1_9ACTN|nr:hypothetical protein AQI88_40570 [Streptomyces cellostaticus]